MTTSLRYVETMQFLAIFGITLCPQAGNPQNKWRFQWKISDEYGFPLPRLIIGG